MTTRRGPHGEEIGLLGYGGMRLPVGDPATVSRLVDRAFELGVNYFDTSPVYTEGRNEAALGRALASHARDAYCLATKLSNFNPKFWSAAASQAMFADSLKLLRTDYVDFYLLHAVGNDGFETFRRRYIDNGLIDWCFAQKKAGRIRNLGWSFHGDYRVFEWMLAQHDAGRYVWDFAMIQMNYVDWRHAEEVNRRNVNAEKLYGELARRKIPVVVMEPLLGGRLARFNAALARTLVPRDPEASLALWALRFAGSHPGVMTVLSGMERIEHLEDSAAAFSPLKPLTDADFAALERAAAAYLGCAPCPCTSCNYCMPCPYGLDIPKLLRFRNDYLAKDAHRSPKEILAAYAQALPEPLRRADHCTGCGRCRPHCPQQIDIPFEIASIDRAIDTLKDEVFQ